MNILLVDTSKKSSYSKYKPLALLKLSTKHKLDGDSVYWVKAGQVVRKKIDIIYFSTIFLFNTKKDVGFIRSYHRAYPKSKIVVGGVAVTLMEDYYRKYCPEGVEFKTGLSPELDKYKPDYDIAGLDFSYGFTSRGCPNKCPWCVVPKVEGDQYIIKDWKQAIDLRFKIFRGMDNNILSCDVGHIEEVFSFFHHNKIKIDFNQAMDCQLLMKREEVQKLFIKYKDIWLDIRFAWDSKRCDRSAIATLDFLLKNKIHAHGGHCMWYMLYDYIDQPSDVFLRVKKILDHKYYSKIKLMRYKDLATGGLLRNWGSIGDLWAVWTSSTITGIISKGTIDKWLIRKDYKVFNDRLKYIASIFEKEGSKGLSNFRKKILRDQLD